MGELLQDLQQIHNLLLLGAPLSKDSHICVCLLNPHVSALTGPVAPLQLQPLSDHSSYAGRTQSGGSCAATAHNEAAGFMNMNPRTYSRREITLLQLTLIHMIGKKAQSQETGSSSRHQYLDILQTLLRQEKVDCQLISLLGSSDKLLSHLAAKCLSCLVLFLLKEENEVSDSWLLFCLKTLSDYPRDSAVAKCMWSLMTIIKELLADSCPHSSESVKKLLPPLDTVFEGFYSSMLSPYSDGNHQSKLMDPKMAIDLSTFLDLLEILVASRLALKSHFACQRVFFLRSSQALALISSPLPYYIRKKLILLLKKCLLQKAGEDFLCGPVASPFPPDPYLGADLLLLSKEVLRVVDLGLLQHLPVSDGASYFGGSDVLSEDEMPAGPDLVQLGALSLTLLKALETKVQVEMSNDGITQGGFQSFMSQLLLFLRSHLPSQRVLHSCEWVCVVFMEQDDDMLEAAKTLLTVYVKSDRLWRRSLSAPAPEEGWTHDAGCNPHCVFLFLLKNVAFDATVLLDFLISSETCFLEYFVRYLKFLREDWTHFCHVCTVFDVSTCKEGATVCEVAPSMQPDPNSSPADLSLSDASGSTDPATFPPACGLSGIVRQLGDNQHTIAGESDSFTRPDQSFFPGALRSLVDYDSSDDSEPETVETLQQNCAGRENSEARGGVCTDLGAELDRLDLKSVAANPKESDASFHSGVLAHTTSEEMLLKSTTCLAELQIAVSRLQRRNLFPYNPSALLKLLAHIDTLQRSTKLLLRNSSTSLRS